jgi:transposase-like protein
LEASYGRRYLKLPGIPEEGMKTCTNKLLVIVDRGPWYRWAFERLRLEYRHERCGTRNRIVRFFGYLEERTAVFHHKMSARNHLQGITNLKALLNLFTPY